MNGHAPASSVLVLTDTGLGSPIPTLFLANTRNSYSTQALRSTTVAVRVFPSITSGTTQKKHHTSRKYPGRLRIEVHLQHLHIQTNELMNAKDSVSFRKTKFCKVSWCYVTYDPVSFKYLLSIFCIGFLQNFPRNKKELLLWDKYIKLHKSSSSKLGHSV